jgi:GntR family transcriptional regulator/MocR family aminotransferase
MTVAIEDPGYPPMRVAFAAAGARLAPVPVDEEGLIVERLPVEAKIICLCPSHQFPLGVSISRDRRKALLAHARRHGAVIVEDDYDGEFRYDGAPLEALVSEDAADVVFYVGTFSKCMLPSLRLGFVIAPDWAMPTLVAAKNSLDWHCPTALQAGVAAFIAEGHLTRHVRKMRRVYGQRRQRLLDALSGPLAPWLEAIPSAYGMHIAAVSRRPHDLDEVAKNVLRDDMRLHTLRRYHLAGPDRDGFIFGLGVADEAQIAAGVARLRSALSR